MYASTNIGVAVTPARAVSMKSEQYTRLLKQSHLDLTKFFIVVAGVFGLQLLKVMEDINQHRKIVSNVAIQGSISYKEFLRPCTLGMQPLLLVV